MENNFENKYERTELLIGEDNVEKLSSFKVAIFGIGGVGGFVSEALARSGIGTFYLFDNDIVSKSNINRQIVALNSTIGKYKVDIMKDRINDINENAKVYTNIIFVDKENIDSIDFNEFDYVIDCIDSIEGKVEIIKKCKELNKNIISSMGAGNKLDPTKFEVSDIYKTHVCPLAKRMRQELKKENIDSLKVVYSTEEPIKINYEIDVKKHPPGSISFVPSVCGLIIAGEVIKDLIK